MKKSYKIILLASAGILIPFLSASRNPNLEQRLSQPTIEHAQQINSYDGSNEQGFIPPPENSKLPPAPPKNIASAETFIPYPGPPATPQARSEAKNPPQPPVIISKIVEHNQIDPNATPNDVNNLLKILKKFTDINYSSEIKSINEVSENTEKNPILFKSTHYRFSFNQQQRKLLRNYMLNGGTIIFNPGRGSKPAFNSALEELRKIIPEAAITELSHDHPAFHSYYDLDSVKCHFGKSGNRNEEPRFRGLTLDCRVLAFVSELGLDSWAEDERDIDYVYSSQDAQKLGVNLIAYANTERAWQKKVIHQMEFEDKEDSSGRISIAQLIYDGEWKTRHAGLSSLLHQFNLKTEVPVEFRKDEKRLSEQSIFNSPIIYLTGHEQFYLSDTEKENLRNYLTKGGLLFAEACCGRKGFDYSFRQMANNLFPNSGLEKIPLENIIFKIPNEIKHLELTPALENQLKTSITTPLLEGIRINDSYAVIYSPYGLSGGWELSSSPYAFGYKDSSALLLGENILMYAVTH